MSLNPPQAKSRTTNLFPHEANKKSYLSLNYNHLKHIEIINHIHLANSN